MALLILGGVLLLNAQDQITYFKYFRTDRDRLADNALAATARIGVAHLEVAYNEQKLPIFVTRYNKLGLAEGYELYTYNTRRNLTHRAVMDSAKNILKVTYYGDDEAWSSAFRDYAISSDQHLTFREQSSTFTFTPTGRLSSVTFRTVDGFTYGAVSFVYDLWNNLNEENWRTLPDQQVVRRYHFDYNFQTAGIALSEFGLGGKLVSKVTLEMAPADELYQVPPPRTGNILDEAGAILDEIAVRKTSLAYPAIIPRTEWDKLVMDTGEELDIQLLEISDAVVRFRQAGTHDDLALPLERVRMVISRYGERVYP